eukprot:g1694.t1
MGNEYHMTHDSKTRTTDTWDVYVNKLNQDKQGLRNVNNLATFHRKKILIFSTNTGRSRQEVFINGQNSRNKSDVKRPGEARSAPNEKRWWHQWKKVTKQALILRAGTRKTWHVPGRNFRQFLSAAFGISSAL